MILLIIFKTILVIFYFIFNEELNIKKFIFLTTLGDILTLIFVKTNIIATMISLVLLVIIYKLFIKYNKLSREYIVIKNGKINFQELMNSKFSLNDIVSSIKKLNMSIEDVTNLIVKNNQLTINRMEYPYTLIIKGIVNYSNLIKINKNKIWLQKFLKSKNLKIEDIFYGFYLDNKTFLITK